MTQLFWQNRKLSDTNKNKLSMFGKPTVHSNCALDGSSIATLGTKGKHTKTCLSCFWSVFRVAETAVRTKGHFCFLPAQCAHSRWLSNDFKHSQLVFPTFKLDNSHLCPSPTAGQGSSHPQDRLTPSWCSPMTHTSSLLPSPSITTFNSSVRSDSRWSQLGNAACPWSYSPTSPDCSPLPIRSKSASCQAAVHSAPTAHPIPAPV